MIFLSCIPFLNVVTSLLDKDRCSLTIGGRDRLVKKVQNGEDFALGHAFDTLGESVEAGVDHVDELVRRVSVLETTGDAMVVHSSHELLELSLVKKVIAIDIASGKSLVDLGHESLECLRVSLELFLEGTASGLLLWAEGILPSFLVCAERGQECLNSILLGLLLNHTFFRLTFRINYKICAIKSSNQLNYYNSQF